MRPLTKRQEELLELVKDNPGLNTAELSRLRNDRQAYQSTLRDRLFKLFRRNLITCQEKRGKNRQIVERKWYATEE